MRRALAAAFLAAALLASCGGGKSSQAAGGGKTGERPLGVKGLKSMTLLTAESGAGKRPVFRWKSVSGATLYSLVLLNSSGKGYWAWEGQATSIPLGGGPKPLPADADGPVLRGKMTWSISAYDSSDKPIAVSRLRPISP